MGSDIAKISPKEETLSRLYSLRAGLSIVAQEKEKADKIMRDAQKAKERAIGREDEKLDRAKDKLNQEKYKLEQLDNEIDEIDNDLIEASKSPGLLVRILLMTLKIVPWFLPAAGLAYIISIFCAWGGAFGDADVWLQNPALHTMYSWIIPDLLGDTEFFDKVIDCIIIIVIGLVALAILGVIAGTSLLISMPDYSYSEKLSAKKELKIWEEKRLRRNQERVVERKELHDVIKNAENDILRQQEQREKAIAVAEENYAEAIRNATEHAVAGLAVIEGLENTYSDMIDARDWENVDIIIYSLETRRADDIKEALQVVDRERHTERIVETINLAGREVCASINTGLKRLQGEMTRCFGLVSDQIALQSQIMANEMGGLRAQMGELSGAVYSNNAYLSQLTSQASMNNALLAKANVSSSEIASQVSALRANSDYAHARMVARGI